MKKTVIGAGMMLVAGIALAAGKTGAIGRVTIVPVVGGTTASPAKPTPTPTPTPTATPTVGTAGGGVAVPAGSLAGLAPIASGINVASFLTPAHGNGALPPVEPAEGAFRMICSPSHNSYDDPIVYPGQPGRAHLHTFFGNTKADGNSTYQSLRTTGDSTCNNLLNRSAYWVPSMMNARGKVVMPDYLTVYYKSVRFDHPACAEVGKACVPLPRGLRYIFGYDMTRSPAQQKDKPWNWDCEGANTNGTKVMAEAVKVCPAGSRLGVKLIAPNCWNGTELDSPDHRSHMAYADYSSGLGLRCPKTHPYIIPQFTLGVWWMTDTTPDRTPTNWYLSSDRMPGMPSFAQGDTIHADWFGAWEDTVQEMWQNHCINKHLNCNSGDLGNGLQMKTLAGYDWGANRAILDPPAR